MSLKEKKKAPLAFCFLRNVLDSQSPQFWFALPLFCFARPVCSMILRLGVGERLSPLALGDITAVQESLGSSRLKKRRGRAKRREDWEGGMGCQAFSHVTQQHGHWGLFQGLPPSKLPFLCTISETARCGEAASLNFAPSPCTNYDSQNSQCAGRRLGIRGVVVLNRIVRRFRRLGGL